MSDNEQEILKVVTKFASEMGDLSDTLNRISHQAETHNQLMKQFIANVDQNNESIARLVDLVQGSITATEELVAALNARSKRHWWE